MVAPTTDPVSLSGVEDRVQVTLWLIRSRLQALESLEAFTHALHEARLHSHLGQRLGGARKRSCGERHSTTGQAHRHGARRLVGYRSRLGFSST